MMKTNCYIIFLLLIMILFFSLSTLAEDNYFQQNFKQEFSPKLLFVVDQEFQSNLASIVQSGNQNNSRISQSNSSNVALIRQIGDQNSALITQYADNVWAVINQIGDQNKAVIKQFRNNNYTTISQFGNKNKVKAVQY